MAFHRMHNLSIKTAISLFSAALFIVAIWVLARNWESDVRSEFEEVLSAQQFSMVEHIADSLEEATQERLAVLTETASMISSEWLADTGRLHRFLHDHKPQYRMFGGGMVVVSTRGKGIADVPQISGREDADFSRSEFFQKVLRTGAPAISEPLQDAFTRRTVIFAGAPVKDAADQVVAVLVGVVPVVGNDLFGEVASRKLRDGGDLHIVSPKSNLVVASTEPKLLLQPLPARGVDRMLDRYRDGYAGSGVSVGLAGVEELSSAKQVPSTGWVVIATLPTAVAFQPTVVLRKEIYVDAAVLSLLFSLMLWGYLHAQLTPLANAARSLDDMTQGKTSFHPLPLEGSKEVRTLIDSFNQLQHRVSEQKAALRKMVDQLQLAATVFERSGESIVITDAEQRILSVNGAFTELTGYQPREAIGKTPRLLASGWHDKAFYRKLWRDLGKTGFWQGEIWDRRKDGGIYPAWLRITAIRDDEGVIQNYVAVLSDISERKDAEARIEYLAYHDALTGLPNRILAMDHLKLAIAHAERTGSKVAILYLDLDNFKTINDSYGHSLGDALLRSVASRLIDCTRDTDTVSRQGGDEFLIILSDVGDTDAIASVAEKMVERLDESFDVEGHELATSSSIGISVYPDDSEDIETLLKLADTAMYHTKESGRNGYRFYTEQMNRYAVENQRIRLGLRRAVERGELEIHYQPQVNLSTGDVVGAEALLRWRAPDVGLMPPGTFIPIAEESGLIVPIGDWVLREACRQAAEWQRVGLPPIVVAVNISSTQFKRGDLERSVLQALDASGLAPKWLELELTESILIDDTEKVLETVQRLKARGIGLSIDDFGTGYSSLAYLKRFNVDKLKIDRSFIADMLKNPQDVTIVRAVIQMARSLNLKTIAEGIEDEHLLSFLRLQYCDEGQGYFFARPMPADDFAHYLAKYAVGKGKLPGSRTIQ